VIDDTVKWVREAIRNHQIITPEPFDENIVHLLIPPSLTTLAYKKMKAYGNHFHVDDDFASLLMTYDSCVASIFQQSQGIEDDLLGVIQYVGMLKQIWQLDYGPMSSPIMLFRCQWVKNGTYNKGNPTYRWDDVRFLLVNFQHLLHELDEPFVFPSQVQCVFSKASMCMVEGGSP